MGRAEFLAVEQGQRRTAQHPDDDAGQDHRHQHQAEGPVVQGARLLGRLAGHGGQHHGAGRGLQHHQQARQAEGHEIEAEFLRRDHRHQEEPVQVEGQAAQRADAHRAHGVGQEPRQPAARMAEARRQDAPELVGDDAEADRGRAPHREGRHRRRQPDGERRGHQEDQVERRVKPAHRVEGAEAVQRGEGVLQQHGEERHHRHHGGIGRQRHHLRRVMAGHGHRDRHHRRHGADDAQHEGQEDGGAEHLRLLLGLRVAHVVDLRQRQPADDHGGQEGGPEGDGAEGAAPFRPEETGGDDARPHVQRQHQELRQQRLGEGEAGAPPAQHAPDQPGGTLAKAQQAAPGFAPPAHAASRSGRDAMAEFSRDTAVMTFCFSRSGRKARAGWSDSRWGRSASGRSR